MVSVTRITFSVPTPHLTQLVSNLVGLVGLVGLVVFVGGVTGNWWWSLGVAAAIAVTLAWVANTHAHVQQQGEAAGDGDAVQLRPVPAAARSAPSARSA
jgi:hypothetical protein